jgi:PqqD family protein of HPr-rel-A system
VFRLEAPPGTLLRPLGTAWAAYSVLSGESHLLNDEAAALLEALLETPSSLADVAELIADEIGVPQASILPVLADSAIEFQACGLIRPVKRL